MARERRLTCPTSTHVPPHWRKKGNKRNMTLTRILQVKNDKKLRGLKHSSRSPTQGLCGCLPTVSAVLVTFNVHQHVRPVWVRSGRVEENFFAQSASSFVYYSCFGLGKALSDCDTPISSLCCLGKANYLSVTRVLFVAPILAINRILLLSVGFS